MAQIRLEHVDKTYRSEVRAIRDVTLDVDDGELLVVVGPSGCGKTTILRILAGLEEPTSGRVFLDETDVTRVPSRWRDVGFVFQRPALFPAKTVHENLLFPERLLRPPSKVRRFLRSLTQAGRRQIEFEDSREHDQVAEIARTLGLEQLLHRRGAELSGGEQQRVALGRVWLRRPAAFLLDEPLSHVDSPLRWELRRQLHLLQQRLNATMIYVTHDPAEALGVADRIAVMGGGELLQVGTPAEIAYKPVSRFVAQFGGKYPLNMLDGRVEQGPGVLGFTTPDFGVMVPREQQTRFEKLKGKPITLGIRPEDVAVSDRASDNSSVEMIVEDIEPVGLIRMVTCTKGGSKMLGIMRTKLQRGQKAMLSLRWNKVMLFDPVSGKTLG